jgi:hypothetical protein
VLANALNWVGPLAMVTAAAGFVLLRWRARRGESGRLVRWVGYAATATLGSVIVLGAVVYGYTVAIYPGALTWPPMLVGGAVLSASLGYLGWAATRCIAAVRAT